VNPQRRATLAYVAPFVVFIGVLAAGSAFGVPGPVAYAVRLAATAAAIVLFSRGYIPWRPSRALASAGLGAVVFVLWIGPDLWFGPSYRHSWVFENPVTGFAASSLADAVRRNGFLSIRFIGATLVVPIVEELFWRGWMTRWLIRSEFLKVPVGQYARPAFWITAVLFASEHGPYWDVGLIAGVLYNLWVIRTRNLADCILAHAVTNGLLAVYIITTGQWQYWL
jgi:CAAX prenyl protease-like protein